MFLGFLDGVSAHVVSFVLLEGVAVIIPLIKSIQGRLHQDEFLFVLPFYLMILGLSWIRGFLVDLLPSFTLL